MSWADTYIVGRHILAVLKEHVLSVIDLNRRIVLQSFASLPDPAAVAWSTCSKHICVLGDGYAGVLVPEQCLQQSVGLVLRWEAPLRLFVSPSGTISTYSFAYPLVAFVASGQLTVADISTSPGVLKITEELPRESIVLAFSYSGTYLALADYAERQTKIFCTRSQKFDVPQITHHPAAVTSILWRPDGIETREMLMTVSSDSYVRVWMLERTSNITSERKPRLVSEIADFKGDPWSIAWVRHGLRTSLEPLVTESSVQSDPPQQIYEPGNRSGFSGAWIIGVDRNRIATLWCLNSTVAGGALRVDYTSCGPVCASLSVVDMPVLNLTSNAVEKPNVKICGVQAIGRYHVNGSGRPTEISLVCETQWYFGESGEASELRPHESYIRAQDHRISFLVLSTIQPQPAANVLTLFESECVEIAQLNSSHSGFIAKTEIGQLTCGNHAHPSAGITTLSQNGWGFVLARPIVLPSIWKQASSWSTAISHTCACSAQPQETNDRTVAESSEGTTALVFEGYEVCKAVPFAHSNAILLPNEPEQPVGPVQFKWVAYGSFDSVSAVGLLLHDGILHALKYNRLAPFTTTAKEKIELPHQYTKLLKQESFSHARRPSTGPFIYSSSQGGFQEYEVGLAADTIHGLGLRLEASGPNIIVDSFKRHPESGELLPAERGGVIHIGDKLLAVNGYSLEGASLMEAIQRIRTLVSASRGAEILLHFEAMQTRVKSDDLTSRARAESVSHEHIHATWYKSGTESDSAQGEQTETSATSVEFARSMSWECIGQVTGEGSIVTFDCKTFTVRTDAALNRGFLVAAIARCTDQRYHLNLIRVHLDSTLTQRRFPLAPELHVFDAPPSSVHILPVASFLFRVVVICDSGVVRIFTARLSSEHESWTPGATSIEMQLQSNIVPVQDFCFSSGLGDIFRLVSYNIDNIDMIHVQHLHLDLAEHFCRNLYVPARGKASWIQNSLDTVLIGTEHQIVIATVENGDLLATVECAAAPDELPGLHFSELMDAAISTPSPWISMESSLSAWNNVTKTEFKPDWSPKRLVAYLLLSPAVELGDADHEERSFMRCLRILKRLNDLIQEVVEENELFDIFPGILSDLDAHAFEEPLTPEIERDLELVEIERSVQALESILSKVVKALFRRAATSMQGAGLLLDAPLRILAPGSLVLLWAICSAFSEVVLPRMRSPDLSASRVSWAELDITAKRVFFIYVVLDVMHLFQQSSGANTEPVKSVKMPKALALHALLSNTQEPLARILLDYVVGRSAQHPTDSGALESASIIGDSFRALSSRSDTKSCGILEQLSLIAVPIWLRNVEFLKKLIMDDALQLFKKERDSMQVMLHYVILRKQGMLLQIAKTDSTPTGQQLAKLLAMDFSSDRGKVAASKNAFVLLGKRMYVQAAAVFLLAEPPLARDATRLIYRNMGNPMLALLIARVLELSPSPGKRTPCLLGPVSQALMKDVHDDSVLLHGKASSSSSHPHTKLEHAIGALACALWRESFMQTETAAARIADELVQSVKVQENCNDPMDESMRFMSSIVAGTFLLEMTLSRMSKEHAQNHVLMQLHVSGLTSECSMVLEHKAHIGHGEVRLDAFRSLCRENALAYEKANVKQTILNGDDGMGGALARFMAASSISDSDVQPTPVDIPRSKGFNFASAAPRAQDPASSQADIFSNFDQLPSFNAVTERGDEDASTASSNIVDSFGSPSQPHTSPSSIQQPSIFDTSDIPNKSQNFAQPSIFDSFDTPPMHPKTQQAAAPAPPSIFDSYDVTPPQSKKQETVSTAQSSIFDSYDMPQPGSKQEAFLRAQSSILDSTEVAPAQSRLASNTVNDYDQIPSNPSNSMSQATPGLNSKVPNLSETLKDDPLTEDFERFCGLRASDSPPSVDFTDAVGVGIDVLATLGLEMRRRALQELVMCARAYGPRHPYMVSGNVLGMLHIALEHCAFQDDPKFILQSSRMTIRNLAKRFQGYLVAVRQKAEEPSEEELCKALCEDLLWWLSETGREKFPAVVIILLCFLDRVAEVEVVVLQTSVDVIQVLKPGMMDLLNGNGGASEVLVTQQQLHTLSVCCQLQTTIAMSLADILPISSSTLALASVAVRTGIVLAGIGRHYDVVRKVVKHPPLKPSGPGTVCRRLSSADPDGIARNPQKQMNTTGWEYTRDVTRAQAESILRDRCAGSFLIRPHEKEPHSYCLSFAAEEAEVRHAVIRIDRQEDGTFVYRCGRLGPLTSLQDVLFNISSILPSGLVFEASDLPVQDTISPPMDATSPHSSVSLNHSVSKEYDDHVSAWWENKDLNKNLWSALGRVLKRSKLEQHQARTCSEPPYSKHTEPALEVELHEHIHMISEGLAQLQPTSGGAMAREALSSLLRIVLHMLALRTFYRQAQAFLASVDFPESCVQPVVEVLMNHGVAEAFGMTALSSPTDLATTLIRSSVFASLRRVLESTELALYQALAPRVTLAAHPPVSDEAAAHEALCQRMLHPRNGVAIRPIQVKQSEDGGEDELWIKCFAAEEARDWLVDAREMPDLETAEDMLITLWRARMLQKIVPQSMDRVQYRYLDPWEVSVVNENDAGALAPGRLGRLWYGHVAALDASNLVTDVIGEWQLDVVRKRRHSSSSELLWRRQCAQWSALIADNSARGALPLWESLRGEAWLVMTLSTCFFPDDREWGTAESDVNSQSNSSVRTGQDPFHRCISTHLYRNALMRRVSLPHRFIAVLQVDLLELKNLSPHFKSHPIDVFACVSLSRGMPPNAKKQVPKPATSEVYLTPVKRVMPQAQPQRERPLSPGGKGNGSPGKSTADGVWRTHAVLRFPLPEHALYATCVGDVLLQPPRILHISVFERKALFGDTRLGDLEVPLTSITDLTPFSDWLPLTSDKNNSWFLHTQVHLRFPLMAIDTDKEGEGDFARDISVVAKNPVFRRMPLRNRILSRGQFTGSLASGRASIEIEEYPQRTISNGTRPTRATQMMDDFF